jgi:hypothetical protein
MAGGCVGAGRSGLIKQREKRMEHYWYQLHGLVGIMGMLSLTFDVGAIATFF